MTRKFYISSLAYKPNTISQFSIEELKYQDLGRNPKEWSRPNQNTFSEQDSFINRFANREKNSHGDVTVNGNGVFHELPVSLEPSYSSSIDRLRSIFIILSDIVTFRRNISSVLIFFLTSPTEKKFPTGPIL